MVGKYSTKDLEQISGIKAHTLRIWEQRYGILKPKRTDTNIRYYSNKDLITLLNVSLLNGQGYKISKIAQLSEQAINDCIQKIMFVSTENDVQIDSLILAMVNINEVQFEKLIAANIKNFGLEQTIENVLFPFLKKLGIMWLTGAVNPAQEHFISNLIRQKIIVAIDNLDHNTNENSKKIIFFLPDSELHEISLLFYHYLAKAKGLHCVYLGQSVPLEDMKKVCDIKEANYIVGVITQPIKNQTLKEYIHSISSIFCNQSIYLSGLQTIDYKEKLPKNLSFFGKPSEFKKII